MLSEINSLVFISSSPYSPAD